MKTNKLIIFLLVLVTSISFTSCVEDGDFEVPQSIGDEQEPTLTGTQVTFSSVKAKMNQSGGLATYEDSEDVYIVGYVVSSDITGNFFEELIIQNTPNATDPSNDSRMGIKINIDFNSLSNTYNFGRKIYVKLAGLSVSLDSGVLTIGSVSSNEFRSISRTKYREHVLRSVETFDITPKKTTISNLSENDLNTIIELEDMQFADTSRGLTFAGEADDEFDGERLLTSCTDASSIILSTSTFSDFNSQVVPDKSGSIVAIYGKDFFGSTDILTLNTPDDINFNKDRCNISDNLTDIMSIKELRDLYAGNNVLFVPGEGKYIEGYVVSSDIRGNFFKNIFIQDKPVNPTAAIQILADENDLFQAYPVGSKVIVKLDKLYLGEAFGDVLSLGYLDRGEVDRIDRGDIGKFLINTGQSETITPSIASLTSSGLLVDEYDASGNPVDADMDGNIDKITAPEGILIKLDNMQLPSDEVGQAYAFYSGTDSANRTVLSCETQASTILRNSGFADFASTPFPTGKGSIVAVLSSFRGTKQLLIRSTEDVNMTGNRCDPLFEDGFSASNLDNWTTFSVTGAEEWGITTFGNPAPSARISGFNSGPKENEDWLISKAIDLSAVSTATLTFETIKRFSGNDLELFMSTDYSGGDPNSNGTWTPLSATYDTNTRSWSSWTSSGAVDVSAAAGGNLFIAFKYTSTSSASATFQIDNVKVSE